MLSVSMVARSVHATSRTHHQQHAGDEVALPDSIFHNVPWAGRTECHVMGNETVAARDLPRWGRATGAHRYRQVRAESLRLAEPLSAEDCAAQSMPDASPAKWHLAHTTWFFETSCCEPREPATAPFDPRYDYLFNSYYEARRRRGIRARARAADAAHRSPRCIDYREHVDERMLTRLLARRPTLRDVARRSSSGCTTSSSTRS